MGKKQVLAVARLSHRVAATLTGMAIACGPVLFSKPTARASIAGDSGATVLPGTTVADSTTGLIYSSVGTADRYSQSAVVRLPHGYAVAHASSAAARYMSLPDSEIANPPADGDLVGSSTLSYESRGIGGQCSGVTINGRWRYQDQAASFKPYGSIATQQVSDVAVDAAGNIYVSNGRMHRVERWSPGSSVGEQVAELTPASPLDLLSGEPDGSFGIALDGAGNLYVADTYGNRVQKWALGASEGVTVASYNRPTRIAVNVDGSVFGLSQIPTLGIEHWAPGAQTGEILAPDTYINAITVDPTGHLYALASQSAFPALQSGNNFSVVKWNSASSVMEPVVDAVQTTGGLIFPRPTLDVDPSGDFYLGFSAVTSFDPVSRDRWVERWSPGASFGTTVAGRHGQGYNADQFERISAVAVDESGNLFVGDDGNGRVQRWSPGATQGASAVGFSGELVGLLRLELEVNGTWSVTDVYGELVALPAGGDWSQGVDYEVRFPNTGLSAGAFCTGGRFRSTGTFLAPDGKALIRNPSSPGTYEICTTSSTAAGSAFHCSAFYLDTAPGTSAELTETPPCTITGTDGPDVLIGTRGDDVICGMGGDDRISSGPGNDVVLAGPGNDVVAGGTGNDQLDGGAGNDSISGGAGDDLVLGGAGDDRINGGQGADVVAAGTGDDRLSGAAGDDRLDGGRGADVINAGPGADVAAGGTGPDRISGSSGDDAVAGGDGSDVLAGSSGSDVVYGGPEIDACKAEPIADLGVVSDC